MQHEIARTAAQTKVRRFVLTSIPFVSLRPGAFLDQITQMSADPFEKKRLLSFGSRTAPSTYVLTPDLAALLAAPVDADVGTGERIDIGGLEQSARRRSPTSPRSK